MTWRAFLLIFCFFNLVKSQALAQITGASCPEAAKFYSKDSINVVTFGASTVQGVGGLNFQTPLENNFKNCYPGKVIDITRNGIFGQTTGQGIERINNAIYGRTGFIFLLMGANDALKIDSGKQTLRDTEINMRRMIVTCLNQNLIPIVGTIQFFDDRTITRYRNVNMQIRAINTLYRTLVNEYKIYLADVNGIMRRDFSLYQDAVHPNARGYRLISFVLFDTINKIIAERFLQFTLGQNYPNPASGLTSIDIVMPESDKVELKLYDMQGKPVLTILNEYLNTGKHTIQLNLTSFAPGVYIYRLVSNTGLRIASKKLVISH